MTSSFSGLLGVFIHTHTHSFPSELGKISVDTISEIRIFAFKGINLAQGPTLGISLVYLFHSFLMSFKVEKLYDYMCSAASKLVPNDPCFLLFMSLCNLFPAW